MTATATDPAFLSRERLAGYEPDALDAACIVVVGAGALGQNAVLTLALSGVRTLVVVDPDAFEDSNRTRSPFYRAGAPKARAVAEGFLRAATHLEPEAFSHVGLVQEVGDLLAGGVSAAWSPTVIVSAVDSNRARAYLAQLCRRFAVPLVEAGFDGAEIGVSVVSNNPELVGEACWACGRRSLRDASGRGLCSLYARQAEASGFTPAIQSTAQLAGALVAEAAIGFAHVRASSPEEEEPELRRRVPLAGHRWHLNLRTGRSVLARLALDPECALDHEHLDAEILATLDAPAIVGELLTAVAREVGPGANIGLLDPIADGERRARTVKDRPRRNGNAATTRLAPGATVAQLAARRRPTTGAHDTGRPPQPLEVVQARFVIGEPRPQLSVRPRKITAGAKGGGWLSGGHHNILYLPHRDGYPPYDIFQCSIQLNATWSLSGPRPPESALSLRGFLQSVKCWPWRSAERQGETEVGPPPSPGEPPRPGVLPKATQWTSHIERLLQRAPNAKAVINTWRIEDGLAVPVPASRIRGNGTNRE